MGLDRGVPRDTRPGAGFQPGRTGRRALLLAPLALWGCGKKPAASGRAGPPRAAFQPEHLLPAGLDLVARLDVARLRVVSSSPALDPLRGPFAGLRSGDRASLLSLLQARATVLWVGLRGWPEAERLDAVLVARGDFASFDPSEGGGPWRSVPSSHPGRRVYERTGELRRSEPALLALLAGEVLALATAVEAPRLRKLLEDGPAGAASMEPPADGMLGVAVKPAWLVREASGRYRNLAAVLGELDAIEATADATDGSLRLDVAVRTATEPGAARVEKVVRAWKEAFSAEPEGAPREAALSAAIERDGPRSLKVRLRPAGDRARKIVEAIVGAPASKSSSPAQHGAVE